MNVVLRTERGIRAKAFIDQGTKMKKKRGLSDSSQRWGAVGSLYEPKLSSSNEKFFYIRETKVP